MPPTRGDLWKYFHRGDEELNSSHYAAYCLGCVEHHGPEDFVDGNDSTATDLLSATWFDAGESDVSIMCSCANC